MPKRPCPFNDNFLPQLKVHVGQKQIDNGISREERMRNVYGKTMNLLKEGVKTLSQKLNSSMELHATNIPSMKVLSSCKSKNERYTKQMVLNNKLQLLRADKAIKDVQPRYDLCECNRIMDQNVFNKCSYCDQVLCTFCLFECTTCSESFCQNCFLPTYDYEEQNKCLTCYR